MSGRSGAPWVPGTEQPAPWSRLSLPSLVGRPGVPAGSPALVLDGVARSHGDLASRAAGVAGALVHRHGIRPGERVAVAARNCLDYLEIEVALASAAAVMVATSWRYTDSERINVLRRSGARAVVADGHLVDALHAARTSGALPDLAVIVALDTAEGADALYEDLAVGTTTLDALPRSGLDDPHEIIYTSGTTGEPKGAVWTQGAVMWNSIQQAMDFGLRRQHSAYVAFDLNYIGGRHQFTWALLHQGGTVHLRRSGGFDATEVIRYVAEHHITHVLWVPTMLYDVLATERLEDHDTSALEMIMCGGAPLSQETLREAQRAFPHTKVVQVYGLTEGGGTVSFVPAENLESKVGSVGLPSLHNEIRIVSTDGSACPVGTVGEILVQGPAMTAGYWDDPAATAEAIRDGWLWTGDLGYRDDDGFVYVQGRRKELIISGGMNIFPREVEDVLREHPAVRDAAVVGLPHERWGETVCAVVERRPGAELTTEELVEHCRRRLAGFKKPTVVVFVTELPRTMSGKIRKHELVARFGDSGRSG